MRRRLHLVRVMRNKMIWNVHVTLLGRKVCNFYSSYGVRGITLITSVTRHRKSNPAKSRSSLPVQLKVDRSNIITSKMTTKYTIVLVRHGESEWNKLNKFCGWFDADLSEQGCEEAKNAGKMLKEKGYVFDVAYTSVLKRAIKTLFFVQNEMDNHWIPVTRHWRLNERHYGGLQGLNKAETAQKHGEAQVKTWRRSYDIPPPALEDGDERLSSNEPKYAHLDACVVPRCECLKDTVARVLPYWHDVIVPTIKSGQRVLISAHGNSLRALVKYLDKVSDAEIPELNIPTGIPLVYELDENIKPVKHYYLADEAQVKAAMEKVANQGKAK